MKFKDRREAGIKLAEALIEYKNQDPLILAIPRGGVTLGAEIARKLNGELDLIITRKIGAPFNPECAIGAVTPNGTLLLNNELVKKMCMNQSYIDEEKEKQIREIKRRMAFYRGKKEYPAMKERTVIVVDDGIATGFTIQAALKSLHKEGISKLILAVPVAPMDTIDRLVREADEVVCLIKSDNFYAVGQFYQSFEQLEDDEVKESLKEFNFVPA